jgi:hypothetical protein
VKQLPSTFESTAFETGHKMMKDLFYNLPLNAAAPATTESFFQGKARQYDIQTNWSTFEDQEMTKNAMMSLFANEIPVVRQKHFLSPDECETLLEILKTHQMVYILDLNSFGTSSELSLGSL